jgi:hypothetical protein
MPLSRTYPAKTDHGRRLAWNHGVLQSCDVVAPAVSRALRVIASVVLRPQVESNCDS